MNLFLLLYIGLPIASSAISVWYAAYVKAKVKSTFDRDFELFKQNSKFAFDVEVEKAKANMAVDFEKFRSTLSLAALEHQVRFTKFKQIQIDAVIEIYSMLVDLNCGMGEHLRLLKMTPQPVISDSIRPFEYALLLDGVFSKKRIFFSKSIAIRISNLIKQIMVLMYSESRVAAGDTAPENQFYYCSEGRNLDLSELREQIPNMLIEIENDLRNLLGEPY